MAEHKDTTQSSDTSTDWFPDEPAIRQSLKAFKETDLLAFIEGELDQSQQDALRAKLADHPELMVLIEALQEDRRRLGSSQAPPMPVGIESDVQSALARPMLVAPQTSSPGTYRRQVNRQARRARLLRTFSAIAAAIAVVAGAVVLLISASGGPTQPEAVEQPQNLASTSSAPKQPRNTPSLLAVAPQTPASPDVLVVAPTTSARATTEAWRLNNEPVPFALILSASTDGQASQLLLNARQRLSKDDGMITVVRNFSMREAVELEQRLLARNMASNAAPVPFVADSTNGSEVPGPWFSGGYPDRNTNRRVDPAAVQSEPSGVLAGPSELAPDYDTQLTYSGKGASYTVAIRLSDMDALLQELAVLPPVSTRLAAIADNAPTDRLDQMAWIREWINQVRSDSEATIIYLPVIVELPEPTR